MKTHWNRVYTNKAVPELGWYEDRALPSVLLIEQCAVSKQAPIVDIGSGASVLIADLLGLGYENLYAVDISEEALEKARSRLGREQAARVHWITADMTDPEAAQRLPTVAVWHDRAMFHFLTTETDRQTYHALLREKVLPGGFVIMAAFAPHGAAMCSGLPVQRHSPASLAAFLGEEFRLMETMDYTYTMPSGDTRPYVYVRFQRTEVEAG